MVAIGPLSNETKIAPVFQPVRFFLVEIEG
jgi:hypothetical protein